MLRMTYFALQGRLALQYENTKTARTTIICHLLSLLPPYLTHTPHPLPPHQGSPGENGTAGSDGIPGLPGEKGMKVCIHVCVCVW